MGYCNCKPRAYLTLATAATLLMLNRIGDAGEEGGSGRLVSGVELPRMRVLPDARGRAPLEKRGNFLNSPLELE